MNNLSQSNPASILCFQTTDATALGRQASLNQEATLVGKGWAIAFMLFTLAVLVLLFGNAAICLQQSFAGYRFIDFLRCFQDTAGPEAIVWF